MNARPRRIDFDAWDARYAALREARIAEPCYGGPLRRHLEDGNRRLQSLLFDNSAASLRLWNFLLTEEDRLHAARRDGMKLVGAMKDLGTVPVIAYSLPNIVAFYPDGAWWLPCVMEFGTGLLEIAAEMGVGDTFCPVRAMLGAFVSQAHFPVPDLLTCSVGATCDDFSAIAQRLADLGHSILWWEIPYRRTAEPCEEAVMLPGGFTAPASQVAHVRGELQRVAAGLEEISGTRLTDDALREGIHAANRVRDCLRALRERVYGAAICPIPALEMQIAEMLAIHFCSDRSECLRVLEGLLAEATRRIDSGTGVLSEFAARVFWVNPVADLRAMNLLEDCGGRICGSDYLFAHALDPIPVDLPPYESLARIALADPMAGSMKDRAERICREITAFGAEGVVISRIPGASHCALEGSAIGAIVTERLGIPVVEIEVPPVCDTLMPMLRTRLEALIETIRGRRGR
jgi:benzoyl-CoA reductase/2-hydroxyglutaryl-CoA dehydratase subunit BcrC/BadD/HgdB